ncbi:TPA: hypothetical protein ACJ51G_001064 [Aeromonas hydrophila subsp. hydrophila]
MMMSDWRSESSRAVLREMLKDPDVDPELVVHAASSPYPSLRNGAALSSQASVDVLVELAWDKDPMVRRSVASNPCCPPDKLRGLAKEEMIEIRLAVAGNPNTPCDALLQLAFMDARKPVAKEAQYKLLAKSQAYWDSQDEDELSLDEVTSKLGGQSLRSHLHRAGMDAVIAKIDR